MSAAKESGTYFKDIYTDLKRQLPEFPTDDPSPNLQECIGIKPDYVNFVRAEMLARQYNLSSEIITHLREMAILQYLVDYKNIAGLQALMQEFNLTPSERSRIVGLIEQEKEYPCFSFSKHTQLAINENWRKEWRNEYLPIVQEVMIKPSVLSRLILRIKRLFGRNA